jgi:hypothetical protein
MKEQQQKKPDKPDPEQEQKPLSHGLAGQRPVGPAEGEVGSTTEKDGVEHEVVNSPVPKWQMAQKPEATMQSETTTQKARGRLTRDAMKIIGKTLEAYYDDVRKEGTPDRFKELLQQFDERRGLNDNKDSGS